MHSRLQQKYTTAKKLWLSYGCLGVLRRIYLRSSLATSNTVQTLRYRHPQQWQALYDLAYRYTIHLSQRAVTKSKLPSGLTNSPQAVAPPLKLEAWLFFPATHKHALEVVGSLTALAIPFQHLEHLPTQNSAQNSAQKKLNCAARLVQLAEQSSVDWILLLTVPQVLHADILSLLVQSMTKNNSILTKNAELYYWDHDLLNDKGRRTRPSWKPDWSPLWLLGNNYVGDSILLSRRFLLTMLKHLNELIAENDFIHQLLKQIVVRQISLSVVHIPHVLTHYLPQERVQENINPGELTAQKGYAESLALLWQTLQLTSIGHFEKMLPEVAFPKVQGQPKVSIIIPFRDQWEVTLQALNSIIRLSSSLEFEILLVNNQSTTQTVDLCQTWLKGHTNARLLDYDQPFNYSAMQNLAAAQAQGELLVLLNNDVEIITAQWLERMAGLAQLDWVGAVGVLLWYPNESLQHAGIVTGLHGAAGHPNRFMPKDLALKRYHGLQEVSAVTAACLMVRKSIFQAIGGFDEEHLTVAFNDVDFCLKLREKRLVNLLNPWVQGIHHESLSRGADRSPAQMQRVLGEISYLQQRWRLALAHDPYYNENLTLDAEDLFLRIPQLKEQSAL